MMQRFTHIASAFICLLVLAVASSSRAAVCSNPGADGPGSVSGIVNTYYPGTGTVTAGSTSVPVSIAGKRGAAASIAAGDLVMIMQMQDADIDSSNTSSYGGSSAGTGYTSLNNAGVYEYAVVSSSYTTGSSPVTITSPLINSYRTAAAGGTTGQRTFQVIRVPQYSSATLTGTVTAAVWDGGTGGVVAFDVAGNLAWGGQTIDALGRGFRGGAARQLAGGAGTNTDYRTLATVNTNGGKGEGIAGTPRWMFIPTTPGNNGAGTNLDTGAEGYPNGSHGRGAPGNAGGGGSDGNPVANDQNTGGGGGGAYSVGGMGGYGWTPGTPPGSQTGGYGGYSVLMSPGRLTMGGGGGSGSTNNATGTPAVGLASSGAAGGGIVIIRSRTISGSGTINASGASANSSVLNDANGGGGAGGAVLVFATNSNLGTLTVSANGGSGGSNTGGGTPHGPGGGGSGGFVALSTSSGVTVNVNAGANGTTAASATSTPPYGSSASAGGWQVYTLQPTDIPGAGSNALCNPLLTVNKITNKADTVQGGNTSYTMTVTNQSGYGLATGVTLSDILPGLPSPITLASTDSVTLSGGATRPVVSNPAAGATSPAWSSFSIPGGGSVALTFTANVPVGTTVGTYQNPGNVTYDDPTRTSAGQTATPGGTYAGGGTVPGSNYLSGSSTQEDVAVRQPAAIAKSFNPASITIGGVSLLSVVISNPNVIALTGASLTDSYPAGLTNTASPSGIITGAGCIGTVTANAGGSGFSLSGATIPASGTCTVSVNVTFASAGSYTNTIPAGALTNSRNVTNTIPASATLNQAAIQPPSVTKTFTPSTLQQGGIATLALTLVNGSTTNLTGIAFTDTLTNMQVATPSVTTNSCGGTLTATAGSGSITLATGALNAGLSCTITVKVTSSTLSTAGGHANTVTGITSAQSGSGPNSNTAYLVVAGVPAISKAFAPSTISPGGTSTLTFTLTNPGNIPLTGVTFSDNLPNMQISSTGPAGGTCSGASGNTFNAGFTNITLSGLTIPSTSSCTVTVVVTSSVSGVQSNITSGVSSNETPVPGNPSAAAALTVLYPPVISKSFAPGLMQIVTPATYTTVSFVVSNLNSATALNNVSFSDTLTNMVVFTPSTISNSCGGTVTAAAGSGSISLAGGSLLAGGSCTITVRVTSTVISPAGGHPNTTSGATSSETPVAGPPSNTAYLSALQAPTVSKAFSPYSVPLNTASTLTFTITNPNAVALTGASFTDTFPVQVTTTNLAQNYIGVGRGTCVGVIPSAQVAGTYYTTRTFSGFTIPANGSCTIMVDIICSTTKGGTACANGNYSNTTTGITTAQTPTVGPVSNTATLAVGRVGISKAFNPTTIAAGETSDITFTLENDTGANQASMTFTDTFPNLNAPNGMKIAQATPLAGSTCTYTQLRDQTNLAALAVGSVGLRVNGISLNNNASCILIFRVNVATAGVYNNTTTGVNYGTTGPPSNTATLTVVNRPTITKSFSPSNVDVYGTSTMTFTLSNSNSSALTNAVFTDTLTGFSVAAPAILGGTCSGVVSTPALTAGATSLNLTVPSLLPGSCTITIPVSSSAAGAYANTTSGITTSQTGATAGAVSNTATLTVNRQPLQVTKAPNISVVAPGGTVNYTIGYGNPNASTPLQNIVISDPVPVYTTYLGASCGALPPAITSCTISAPSVGGTGNVTWTLGGTLNAGSSGTVTLSVRVD